MISKFNPLIENNPFAHILKILTMVTGRLHVARTAEGEIRHSV